MMKKRSHIIRWIGTAAALAGLAFFLISRPVQNPSWEQPTMGTTAHITLSGPVRKGALRTVRAAVDDALETVNRQMSTWQNHTEISAFNRSRTSDPFPVSPAFAAVVERALDWSAATDGAFDPTVKPLVDHWGFGPQSENEPLEQIMPFVGWQKVRVQNDSLIKTHPQLQLDLSAIAKGYGVDEVLRVIRAQGVENVLVEIGGELAAAGKSPAGGLWRIGIESPEPDRAFGDRLFRTLELSGRAMATSGDYRRFRTREDGTRYSHIIDPRTGRPAETDIAAVTVLADNCTDADAAATALFVMGSEQALRWLEKRPGLAAFFILHHPGSADFISRATENFPASGNR
jgi:FAD:protein FMN transferase